MVRSISGAEALVNSYLTKAEIKSREKSKQHWEDVYNSSVLYSFRYRVQVTRVIKGVIKEGDIINIDFEIERSEDYVNKISSLYLHQYTNMECFFAVTDPWGGFGYMPVWKPPKCNRIEETISDFRYQYGKHIAIMDFLVENLQNLKMEGSGQLWQRMNKPDFDEIVNSQTMFNEADQNFIREWWSQERKRYKMFDSYNLDDAKKELMARP